MGSIMGATPTAVVLARQESSVATVSVSVYRPGLHVPAHSHGTSQLCVLLDGKYVTSWRGSRHECRRGDAVFHPAGVVHEDWLFGRTCQSLRVEWKASDHVPWLTSGDARKVECRPIRFMAECIAAELKGTPRPPERALKELLLELRAELGRSIEHRPLAAPEWLRVARDIAQARSHERLQLQQLAQLTGTSRSRMSAAFRTHVGLSVGEFIQRCRVERAEELMVGTELDLPTIALSVGFCDQSHLNRVFRKLRGISPAAWRRFAR